jgi:hypothetical protein
MNATINVQSAGMFRIEFKLNMADKTHRQFADWVADLEQSSVGTWSSTMKRSNLLYKNGFRVMFFADTNAFDSSGKLSADFFKAKSVSAIFALSGLWTSADKYGLRFNVKQFKFFEDALEYPDVEDNMPSATVADAPMFVDDD